METATADDITTNSSSDDYVIMGNNVRVKKQRLMKSGLYSALLSSVNTNNETSIPLPPNVSDAVSQDYLKFINSEQTVIEIMDCIKACSIIDDKEYLEHCVRRMLCYYSLCCHQLSGLNPYLLEQVYLLIPKDLWPEDLQNSDEMLAKLISAKYDPEENNEFCIDISYIVDDNTYRYELVIDKDNKDLLIMDCILSFKKGYKQGLSYKNIVWNLKINRRVQEDWYEVQHDGKYVIRCKKTWHDNGILSSSTDLDNKGRKHGLMQTFDKDGNLAETNPYDKGSLHGEQITYYPGLQQIRWIAIYRMDKCVSCTKYFASGNIQAIQKPYLTYEYLDKFDDDGNGIQLLTYILSSDQFLP